MDYPDNPGELTDSQVDMLLEDFLSSRNWKESTRGFYRQDLKRLAEWAEVEGFANLFCLRKDDIQRYVDERSRLGDAPGTLKRGLPRVPSLFEFAHERGVVLVDVGVRAVRFPKRNRQEEKRTLEADQLQELLRVASHLPADREAAVRLVGIYGFSAREIQELTVGDLHASDDSMDLLNAGAGETRRLLPLDARTSALLRGCRDGRHRGPLLRNRQGGGFSVASTKSAIRRAAELAGIEDRRVTPGQVRATMIQYAVERGIQGHKLAKSLGFTTLRLFEYYLPPGLDIVPDVGLQVAESLAPDPTTRLTSFLVEEMAKDENRLPAAGLCALIGLLAEHHLRLALKYLGGSVAGPSGGTLVNLQGAVIKKARELSRPVGTLGRDVNRLAGIRDLASHGHLNEISNADVDEAYRLLSAIEHDLRAMLARS